MQISLVLDYWFFCGLSGAFLINSWPLSKEMTNQSPAHCMHCLEEYSHWEMSEPTGIH